MKNSLHFLLVAAFCLFGFASCKKEGHGENKSVTLNVTVNAGDTYKLDLSPYGDEDDIASIAKQATDYNISAISTDVYSRKYVYTFSRAGGSKAAATGTDQVVLKINEPEGRCRNHDETNITINFTVN